MSKKATKEGRERGAKRVKKTCRATNCNIVLTKKRHVFCNKHYHQKHLEGLRNPNGNQNNCANETDTIDTLNKKCKAFGCNQIVFRESHDVCRTHIHELRARNSK
jgi:hypothetical protein